MIEGFKKETEELSDNERALLPFVAEVLRDKKGKEKAITNSELSREALRLFAEASPGKKAPGLEAPRLRKIIHAIRCEELLPLLCANSRGYFLAATKEEAALFIESLRQRRSSLEELSAHLAIQFSRFYTPIQTTLEL